MCVYTYAFASICINVGVYVNVYVYVYIYVPTCVYANVCVYECDMITWIIYDRTCNPTFSYYTKY